MPKINASNVYHDLDWQIQFASVPTKLQLSKKGKVLHTANWRTISESVPQKVNFQVMCRFQIHEM